MLSFRILFIRGLWAELYVYIRIRNNIIVIMISILWPIDPLLSGDSKQKPLLCSRRINTRSYATVEVLFFYNSGNGVFYLVRVEMLYAGSAEFQSRSFQQFSWAKWCEVTGWWENSVVRRKSVCEEKTRKLVWNGRQPGTQLSELSVDKSSAREPVTKGPERGKLKNLPR
jgi:hypothetical protein